MNKKYFLLLQKISAVCLLVFSLSTHAQVASSVQSLLEENGFQKTARFYFLNNLSSKTADTENFYSISDTWGAISYRSQGSDLMTRIVNLQTGAEVLRFSNKDYGVTSAPVWDEKAQLIYYSISNNSEDYLEVDPRKPSVTLKKVSENSRVQFPQASKQQSFAGFPYVKVVSENVVVVLEQGSSYLEVYVKTAR